MELQSLNFTLHQIPNLQTLFPIFHTSSTLLLRRFRCRRRVPITDIRASAAEKDLPATVLEQPGGKMVVELVGAFNELTERMNYNALSTSSSRILFKALKLSIPILQTLPLSPDGRSPLSKALSVAVLLADLQVCFFL